MATDPAVLAYLEAYSIPETLVNLATRDVAHFVMGQQLTKGQKLDVFEPSTGMLLCHTFEADVEVVNNAVAAARSAFEAPEWSGLRPLDRQALILALADLIEENADELAFLESVDVGKPISQAVEIDIGGSCDVLRYFAGWCGKIDGRSAPLAAYDELFFGITLKRPVGVVVAIVPWNFPLQTLVWKAAAALTTGCTLVIKPSETTPLTALRFAELASEAGFPPGVINVVNGTGPITGSMLVAHPDVNKVTFTGSTETGLRVGRAALGSMKRLTLELGGKSPVLVTRNADLDLAVEGVINGIFFNAGQVCDAGSRVIVDVSVAREFQDKLLTAVQTLSIGPGLGRDNFFGPLASAAHKKKVSGFVEQARKDGLLFIMDYSDVDKTGYFHGPVIIRDCPTDHPLWCEELFGPVLVLREADGLEEMLHLGNDTHFGLGAAVFSKDHGEVMKLARGLKAGTIYINGHGFLDPAFPFGGQGMSGFGKDMGPEQIDSYLETSSVLFSG